MSKHAYLIQAHKSDDLFYTLLKLIDYPGNDIFIHMDAKNTAYQPELAQTMCKQSAVYHCEPISVSWGGYSQVQAELSLLSLSTQTGKYAYYHLISGQDLPLKSQKYIHEFFSDQKKEFVQIESPIFAFSYRVRYYYFFQEKYGKKLSFLGKHCKKIQKILKINRNKSINFQKGANWFSITDNFARYVLSQKEWISKVFSYTVCADELFLQTLLINSPFKDNIYCKTYESEGGSILRHIDWERGTPYVFRIDDYEQLINSDCLFARKFDPDVDNNIISLISNYILNDYEVK